MAIQVVILAAGQGKRMHSTLPKVLHPLAGKPLLAHVIELATQLSTLPMLIVCGHQSEKLKENFRDKNIIWVQQDKQLGTGHALLQALPHIKAEQVLVLYGDVPCISSETLQALIMQTPKDAIGIVTAQLDNPKNYGRIKRDAQQSILKIIEEKDGSVEELNIKEINSGIYVFPTTFLQKNLSTLNNKNAQGEYYLTDLIDLAVKQKINIHTVDPGCATEILGVNNKSQLAQLERFYQHQQAEKILASGVTLMDPARFDLRGNLKAGQDVSIDINVILEGDVVIGDRCDIGPHCILRNVTLGDDVIVKANSIIEDSHIGAHAIIGPFARIRPDSVLKEHVHIGNFVEIKKSNIGAYTKINHLSYVGDSDVGSKVNIGAGTITCNYDGYKKHKTIIEDGVQVGSNTTLVAPLTVHQNAYIASATNIRHDVSAGALVYNPREEVIKEGWTKVRKEKMKEQK